jgi:hypothetical protein
MDYDFVLQSILKIIDLEKLDHVDYGKIKEISLRLISYINSNNLYIEPQLYRFIDDFDIRSTDKRYAEYQTKCVISIIDNCEFR